MRNTLDDIAAEAVQNPMRVASRSMKPTLRKRFYQIVDVVESQSDHAITLDGKPVKTPAGNPLEVSSKQAAELIAAEWSSQKEFINPLSMPVTRLVNTAIDGVSIDLQAVKEDIIRFVGSDLLCYRADTPTELVVLQNKHWDPLLDWAHMALNTRLTVQQGIVHVVQPVESIAAFSSHIGMIDDPLKLAAVHSMTALTGSAVIAMAVLKKQISAENAWLSAHVDENWQVSQWGEDQEAQALRAAKIIEFEAAVNLLDALR